MSAALHLAKPDDLDRVLALVSAFQTEAAIEQTDADRRAALEPLLAGSPYGAVYLIGPARAPIGYLVVTFGWSIEFGGMDGKINEIFIRPGVRGRGVASEALAAVSAMLGSVDMKAIHLEVDPANESALRLYKRAHFKVREGLHLMTRRLS